MPYESFIIVIWKKGLHDVRCINRACLEKSFDWYNSHFISSSCTPACKQSHSSTSLKWGKRSQRAAWRKMNGVLLDVMLCFAKFHMDQQTESVGTRCKYIDWNCWSIYHLHWSAKKFLGTKHSLMTEHYVEKAQYNVISSCSRSSLWMACRFTKVLNTLLRIHYAISQLSMNITTIVWYVAVFFQRSRHLLGFSVLPSFV